MSRTTILLAEPHHLDALTGLLDRYRVFYGQPPAPENARAFLTQRLALHDSLIFLASERDTGQPAGFIQLYPSFSTVSLRQQWLLNDLFVAEEYRRQGIGSLLVRHAEEHLRGQAKGLILVTGKDNLQAKSLYGKLGWKTGAYDFYYHFFA